MQNKSPLVGSKDDDRGVSNGTSCRNRYSVQGRDTMFLGGFVEPYTLWRTLMVKV